MMVVATAFAQEDVPVPDADIELFRTAVDGVHTTWTDDAVRPDDGRLTVRTSTFVASRSLVYAFDDGTDVTVLGPVVRTDLALAYARFGLQAAVLVPAIWSSSSDVRPGGTGLGDLALDLRAVLVEQGRSPLGLGVGGRLTLPTHTLDLPLGAAGPTGEISVVASRELGPVLLALNLGQRFAPRADVGGGDALDEAFAWRVGGGVPLGDVFDAALEAQGRVEYAVPPALGGATAELLASGGAALGGGVVARLGVGKGLTNGIGVPNARVVLGLSWSDRTGTGEHRVKDIDGDGIADVDDTCDHEAEDPDGVRDDDGCPDLDDDGDGIVDAVDQCPAVAEDVDGYKDQDGCPDEKGRLGVRVVTSDGEVLQPVQVVIDCPDLTRTISADQAVEVDQGTCTLSGGGADGIPSFFESVVVDGAVERTLELAVGPIFGRVAVVVEDPYGHPIEQAAWSFDRQSPMRVAGQATALVAPGEHTVKVYAKGRESRQLDVVANIDRVVELKVTLALEAATLSKNRIVLGQPIAFEPGSAALTEASGEVLDAVAEVLGVHTEIPRVRIEAHVEEMPGAQDLTEARAAAVRDALAQRGVEAARLEPHGMGAGRPLPEGSSERVELWVEAP